MLLFTRVTCRKRLTGNWRRGSAKSSECLKWLPLCCSGHKHLSVFSLMLVQHNMSFVLVLKKEKHCHESAFSCILHFAHRTIYKIFSLFACWHTCKGVCVEENKRWASSIEHEIEVWPKICWNQHIITTVRTLWPQPPLTTWPRKTFQFLLKKNFLKFWLFIWLLLDILFTFRNKQNTKPVKTWMWKWAQGRAFYAGRWQCTMLRTLLYVY